ncbi:sulfotransferase family 2 domain-containing protein [Falsihalocynthiibacter sp. S25ZX9]|uniref:Type II secretory pathway, pullulanase PulA n=1 Tax=Falsihalocynthiibacter arcticus TaxID=1579316 RepID=A0A126UW24_9RHOB|nr:sulfotransferase family 2 domain-containing protein [Falsihalocynthiibacter arcticus]AML50224.1 hypothetical protein RC74_02135 [Falsihalocynthiibacter arcticus]
MIISSGRQFVFVHIPKTGGTALSLALEGRAMKDDILIGDTPKAKARHKRQRTQFPHIRMNKHANYSVAMRLDEDVPSYYCFTLVRNPWDRLVSYYHWLRVQSFSHRAVTLAQTLPFAAFIRAPSIMASLKLNNYASYMSGAQDAHFLRLEHLETDLLPLWEHLGFSLSPIAQVNTSERKADYRSYYTDADAEHARLLLAADVQQFAYSFS